MHPPSSIPVISSWPPGSVMAERIVGSPSVFRSAKPSSSEISTWLPREPTNVLLWAKVLIGGTAEATSFIVNPFFRCRRGRVNWGWHVSAYIAYIYSTGGVLRHRLIIKMMVGWVGLVTFATCTLPAAKRCPINLLARPTLPPLCSYDTSRYPLHTSLPTVSAVQLA